MDRWQKALTGLSQPEGFLAMAQTLASLPLGLEPSVRVDLVLLLTAVLVNQAQGSSYLPLGDRARLAELLEPFLAEAGDWTSLLNRKEIQCLLSGPQAPLHLEGDRLYSRRILEPELQLADQARSRNEHPPSGREVDPLVMKAPDNLEGEQRKAVAAAVRGSLTLVTGGPGTGKTSIIVAMLRSLVRGETPLLPGEILLAAPTGKAAQRMRQAIQRKLKKLEEGQSLDDRDKALLGMEPKTLHVLLGWSPTTATYKHHGSNLLATKAVIVDEASMISLELMNALFAAVPRDAVLVLLGDSDQLPSVEAGRAFLDLVTALPGNLHSLRHSFRMNQEDPEGSQILTAARAINSGEVDTFWQADPAVPFRLRHEEVASSGVEVLAPTPENLEAFCTDWALNQLWTIASEDGGVTNVGALAFEPMVRPSGSVAFSQGELDRVRQIIRHYESARVLCPVNAGADLRSVESLNAFFHAQTIAKSREQGGLDKALALVAGEPVMVRHNDYRRGIYNGDQGLVMRVERGAETHREVFFPQGDGFLNFPMAAIQEELDLCYAMTVHKAQGSEFRRIALILPERESPLLTREILYTALTRAEKVVTIIGSKSILEGSIRKPVIRWSGLASRINPDLGSGT
jgi:exodeoxyribonuclease V alpha subunit